MAGFEKNTMKDHFKVWNLGKIKLTQGNPVKSQIKLYFYTVQNKIYILNVIRYI